MPDAAYRFGESNGSLPIVLTGTLINILYWNNNGFKDGRELAIKETRQDAVELGVAHYYVVANIVCEGGHRIGFSWKPWITKERCKLIDAEYAKDPSWLSGDVKTAFKFNNPSVCDDH